MFKKPLLKELLFFSILVSILHSLALNFHLYWSVWWFDIPMHFLGGLVIGFLVIFIFYTSEYLEYLKLPKEHLLSIFIITLSFVMLVGLVWELWELFMGFSDVLKDRLDTIIDLIMDILGGITAFVYSKEFLCQKKD